MMLSKEYLLNCFDYNPTTGDLSWKLRPRDHFSTDRGYNTFVSQRVGKTTGCRSHTKDGLTYLKVAINKKLYLAHRLIWIMNYGDIPIGCEIDHVDHNGENNSLGNLRLVTSSQNKMNRTMVATNKSGCMGVYFNKRLSKWVAEIVCNSKYHSLGYFSEYEHAVEARKNAEIELDFHSNHGGDKVVQC